MAVRIGEYVVAGELRNTRRNGVYGWIEFAPDYGIRIELTGNFSGQIEGKNIEFRVPAASAEAIRPGSTGSSAPGDTEPSAPGDTEPSAPGNAEPSAVEGADIDSGPSGAEGILPSPDKTSNESSDDSDDLLDDEGAYDESADDEEDVPFADVVEGLADRQIGVVELMELRNCLIPDLPLDDFLQLPDSEQKQHLIEKPCLYLSWHSQNGNIVAEVIDAEVVINDVPVEKLGNDESGEPLAGGGFGIGFTEVHVGEGDSEAEGYDSDDDDDEGEDDPYGLFGKDLERSVAEALGGSTDDDSEEMERPWDSSEPGLDPDTKKMYEQWDEIFEGNKDEPITYLFSSPLKLPKPENVSSDEEAQPLNTAILAELARLSVAIDVCEHYTPQETYRLLMTEILPTAKVHPNLAASEMVQHYSTSDFCSQCDAEFESRASTDKDELDDGDAAGSGDATDDASEDQQSGENPAGGDGDVNDDSER